MVEQSRFSEIAAHIQSHLAETRGEGTVASLIDHERGEAVFTVSRMGKTVAPRIEAQLREWLGRQRIQLSVTGSEKRLGPNVALIRRGRKPGLFFSVATGTRKVPGKVIIRVIGGNEERKKWLLPIKGNTDG